MEQCFERAEAADSRETPEARAAKPEIKYPQKVSIRTATDADLPLLQDHLAKEKPTWEQGDLRLSIVYVAEFGGEIVGFCGARLVWQVEPLVLFRNFEKHAPHFAQQKATYRLIQAVDGWIADRRRNTTGIYSYFCRIVGRRMQMLALSFGMIRTYTNGKFFGRDT